MKETSRIIGDFTAHSGAGGREHFVYSNNNISSHKECETFRFICFDNSPSGTETVSFSQFDKFKGSYMFDPYGIGIDCVYSHLNVLNATVTSSFTRSWIHASRSIHLSSCVFADIDPVTISGSVEIYFASTSFAFPKSYLPSSCSFDLLCEFEFSNPTLNRLFARFKGNCANTNQFTNLTDTSFAFMFIFHNILSP